MVVVSVNNALNLATVWEAVADAIPAEAALAHGEHSVTWAAFDERAARLAAAFNAAGLGPGSKIAIDLYNCTEWLESFYAAIKIRAIPANVNYRYLDRELVHILSDSDAEALVFHASFSERIMNLRAQLPKVRFYVQVQDDGAAIAVPADVADYEQLIAAHAPAPRIERSFDDQYLSYTGGTTGLPKGVMVSLGAGVQGMVHTCALLGVPAELSLRHADAAKHLADSGKRPVAIPASPLMHSTGLGWTALPTLTFGGQVVTLRSKSFDAHELLSAIERHRASMIAIVGDAFARPIARALEERVAAGRQYALSTLQQISSAGVAFSADTKDALFRHIPKVMVFDACGASEGIAYGYRQYRKGDTTTSANFMPAPGLVLLGEDGSVLPSTPGQVGLLANVAQAVGYYKDAEKTARTYRMINGVRYAVPGDYGRLEADGSFTLLGRSSNTINTGGEKVHPEEVEDILKSVAGVDDCLVFGTPDERFGQQVTAIVQLRPGASIDEQGLIAAVRERLAHYKAPKKLLLCERVPRAPNGKPDYVLAREMVLGKPTAK
jgi:acyl-CoA synthetase (AMP-forming)/AMP-acid ligase II